MESLLIEGTPKTPSVKLDPVQGLIEIKGRSNPENTIVFYKPIIDWIEEYAKNPREKTTVNIHLEHFNTLSSKSILDVFRKLETIYKTKHEVIVNWHHEKDDEDIVEAGKDYQYLIGIPFLMIEIDR
jgi:hypothetical protein